MILHFSPASATYQSAAPFPHEVIDNLFDLAYLNALARGFPDPDSSHWRRISSPVQVKYTTRTDETLPWKYRDLLARLNSSTMLNWLEGLTGIRGLIPDPHFDGAGPHMIGPGGHLGLHTDYNRNKRLGLDRRLNLLLYLNRDWREEWGGHLELWSHSLGFGRAPKPKALVRRILPAFGRVVVFNTDDFSFHGHPDPLRCSPGVYRRSIAMYYFTAGRPKGETWVPRQAGQNTLFYPRPGSRDVETQGLAKAYLRWVPGWAQGIVRRWA